jgi:HSP20 family molecular chaperone IbpA
MAWIMHPALGKTTVEDFLDRKNEAADWFDKYRNKKETKEAIDFLSEHFEKGMKASTNAAISIGDHLVDRFKHTLTDTGYEVSLLVPGFNKDTVKISFDKGQLTVSLLNKDTKNVISKQTDFNCDYSNFDLSKTKATVVDGILKLSLQFKKGDSEKFEVKID